MQNSVSGQLIESSGGSYIATLPSVHDSNQVTWTDNQLPAVYNKIESENATTGIPAAYNHACATPQLRDLLLPSLAAASTVQCESETATTSSEIPPVYNHTSPPYNHNVQLRDLLMTSRAQTGSGTSSPPSLDDVTAVTSRPLMTSPVGVVKLRVKLCNSKLWRQFHACTNEMIITKAGRSTSSSLFSISQ